MNKCRDDAVNEKIRNLKNALLLKSLAETLEEEHNKEVEE